ncbi:MAG: putative aromatic acid transporter [Alphaproteobacteria bacterium]|nr:putative aromatic acid transporter [Alphaproteobacteria bacterium]
MAHSGTDKTTGVKPLAEALDGRRVTVWQMLLIVLTLSALILDGFDSKLLSYAAPLILKEWSLTQAAFSTALAAAMAGMAIGAAVGGWLGDRSGRRNVIVGSLIVFGIATIGSGLSPNKEWMTLFRLISGIGFGAIVPNAFVLCAEWLPPRLQSRVIAIMAVGSPAGGMVGAGITITLLPEYGWRGVFIIAGVATAILGFIMFLWLPESPTFSVLKGREKRLQKDWRRIIRAPLPVDSATLAAAAAEQKQQGIRPRRSIFVPELLRLNVGLALLISTGPFAIYIFGSWMPVILTTAGLRISDAIEGSFALNLLAVIAGLSAGELVRRYGTLIMYIGCAVLMIVSLATVAAVLAWSPAPGHGWTKIILLAALGGYGGGGGALVSVASANMTAAYPIDRRATGVGFGVTCARIGMIISIFAGGHLLTGFDNNPNALFLVAGLAMLVVIASSFIVDRHIPSRRSTKVELTPAPAE